MGNAPGEFKRPEGLCVDAQDRVYVADSCNHRIQIFSRDGQFIRAYGKAGSGKGELSYPYDICVDAAGRQYVCEFGNSRIQVFDANDQPLEIIGGPGAEPGRFSNPWGVALDSAGNLYVADSQNHRVQKFIRKQSVVSSQGSVYRRAKVFRHRETVKTVETSWVRRYTQLKLGVNEKSFVERLLRGYRAKAPVVKLESLARSPSPRSTDYEPLTT